jgi:hypothetical protein
LDVTALENFEFIACLAAAWRFLKDIWEWARKVRHERVVAPKLRLKQVFLDEVNWYEERAAKLAAFCVGLPSAFNVEKQPDKWKLATLVSKLDHKDQQTAIKSDDYEELRQWALRKGQECHDNADAASRMATEVDYKILAD